VSKFPSQRSLQLPLLSVVDTDGNSAKQAADRLAEHVELTPEQRSERVYAGRAGHINAWDRHVRYVALKARKLGLLESPEPGWWSATSKGSDGLRMGRRGMVITVFVTDRGEARWGYCEDAVQFLSDGEVNLILTSPPYPLHRQKGYGGEDHRTWLSTMRDRAATWVRVLAHDGSLVINLGQEWRAGAPVVPPLGERLLLSLIDDLGLHLCQTLFWENPSKMPAPAEWVTIRRERLTPSVERLYWLSRSPHPNADSRRILRPYSDRMRARLRTGGDHKVQSRPSGHEMAQGAFGRDNGGSIAHALLDESSLTDLVRLANTNSNEDYIKRCKSAGLPVQPARMPSGLADVMVLFLTEPDDLVYDPFAGSLTTAAAAERHGRRWVADECSLSYLAGSQFRFDSSTGFKSTIGA
jgi:DNA modification methylase